MTPLPDYPAGAVVGYSGSLYLALKDNGAALTPERYSLTLTARCGRRLETAADLAKAFGLPAHF